jgi:LysM repeat protein/ABC-type branched-subunit amino acid transport system substrate-binding protein
MIKLRISLLLVFIFFSIQNYAQGSVDIQRSTKIEVVNGQKFYIHKVEKHQTAYSLSKAYGVSVDDIYKYNPGAENGLQLDQYLKIPFTVKAIGQVELLQDSISEDGNFIYHRVEQGETLYRIMKKFNVNQDVLFQYNKGLTANLHPNDVIKIPTQDKLISDKALLLYDKVISYKVKKKDTYYKLEKKFGVNQQQLEQLNPQLRKIGLQKGLSIMMPAGLKKLDTIPTFVEIQTDSLTNIPDSLLLEANLVARVNCDSNFASNDTFRIALMMPFFEEDEQSIRTVNAYYTKEVNAYRSFTFIQFYEGFLMALDSIKQKGFHAEVYIYDTKNDTAEVSKIIQKPEFKTLDLIIGPLFTQNLQMVLDSTRNTNTIVVSPFSREKSLVANNPHLFKLAPNANSLVESSCDWVADSMPDARIMIIHEGSDEELKMLQLIKENFHRHAGNGIDTNNIFIYPYTEVGVKKMINNLAKDQKNVLVNLVDNEAIISNFIRTLNNKSEDFEIYLMGSEWHWKRYKTLEIKYLVNMHLTLCSSYFVDNSDTLVQAFEKRFVSRYQTLPNSFAYTSFDIAWYFMNALYYYGTDFKACINNMEAKSMHTNFQFRNSGNSAFENTFLNIYQYDNYQLIMKRRR